ncbi:class I SAM-dependent methyltransferase [Candidatus Pacearchaeota archaeon]|jgi:2-polyprenyl-3-methyl-5-hydroxy-6-metoxy-1,4-benzoquinol methylase|nr:class I SAM-dependent methyltransferase [Candidatus Pacearchaeota archaeon]
MGELKGVDYYNDPANHDLISRPLETSPWRTLYAAVADSLGEPDGRLIVELGCGTGRLARVLADRGWTGYLGIDFADRLIDQAALYAPECLFFCADIFSEFTEDALGRADVVVAMEVLEHLENDLAVFGHIVPGTFVVFDVPNFDCASHVRHFTDIGQVMERYGPLFDELRVTPHRTGDGTYWIGQGQRKADLPSMDA